MTIQERKEREKQELRDLILSTAAELFRTKGYEKTSIRAIADAIDYSPGTIYRYFKDKDELMFEISETGFKLFHEYQNSVSNIENPLVRLKKIGESYIKFALDYPSYYELMFIMPDPIDFLGDDREWKNGLNCHDFHLNAILECQQLGHFKDQDPMHLSLMVWAQVHGIIALHLKNRLDMYEVADQEQLLFDALASFNHMLDSQ
ncbi:TetR/AcrR family transcriptional regulator [Rhodohalobacter sp. SW132]|uniref:TetR/AcrR family transcriptional regulator n=1 Tax=Rhodohalobacter sp. SW132 TaxID=2293433 RepID=UPI000E2812D4|nr:TetR/AcrR family transcriptional regulator [Rhodohalobacter sp. SW132]REL32917.1 TetR/AcrR family transcriptional regulator [Rhodohalobacter sp. SW132]